MKVILTKIVNIKSKKGQDWCVLHYVQPDGQVATKVVSPSVVQHIGLSDASVQNPFNGPCSSVEIQFDGNGRVSV